MPVRIRMTEIYRDWINALKDRSGRARIQVREIGWRMAIRESTGSSLKESASSKSTSGLGIGSITRRVRAS